MNRQRKSASKSKKHPVLGDTSNTRTPKAWARPKMRELRGSSTKNPWVLDAAGNLVLQDSGQSTVPALCGGAAISAALHAAGAKHLSHLLPPPVPEKPDLQNAPPRDSAQLTSPDRSARQKMVVRKDWWSQLQSSARTRPVARTAAQRARRMGREEA